MSLSFFFEPNTLTNCLSNDSSSTMNTYKARSTADALKGLWALSLTVFVIASLYFAREVFIPLALAALLTFVLSSVV